MTQTVSLPDLQEGQRAHISALEGTGSGIQEKLLAMGILPGRKIWLIKKFPSYVFEIGNSRFAVDRDIAQAILVIPEKPDQKSSLFFPRPAQA